LGLRIGGFWFGKGLEKGGRGLIAQRGGLGPKAFGGVSRAGRKGARKGHQEVIGLSSKAHILN